MRRGGLPKGGHQKLIFDTIPALKAPKVLTFLTFSGGNSEKFVAPDAPHDKFGPKRP